MKHAYVKIVIADQSQDYSTSVEFDGAKRGSLKITGQPFPADFKFMAAIMDQVQDYDRKLESSG